MKNHFNNLAKALASNRNIKKPTRKTTQILNVMDDSTIEQIIIKAVEIGVYCTLNRLGITHEVLTESQARKLYGKRLIDEWRRKRWIVGYPTGNRKRAKVYFKRTELETASRMLDIQNIIPANKIFRE